MQPQDTGTSKPRLAVIVPVYNAMPYLNELIDSLRGQDLSSDDFEVLFVDDGSDDGSPETLDRACEATPNFRVIHQANSGWAGGPRNVGLDNSDSDYVFFSDSDDVLSPTALRTMLDYADEHGSDVVIPRVDGLGGRQGDDIAHSNPVASVPLATAFRTLSPLKLYRRSLLKEHGIRFPEGKIRLEDGIFNAQVYTHANQVSQLAGEAQYFLRNRDDGQNISKQALPPEGYTQSIAKIIDIVGRSDQPKNVRDSVILTIYRRKALKIYKPERFRKYSPKRRGEWLDAHGKLIEKYIPEELERKLSYPYNLRSSLVRSRDEMHLLDMDTLVSANRLRPKLSRGLWSKVGLQLQFAISIEHDFDDSTPTLELRHRKNGERFFSVLTKTPRDSRSTQTFTASLTKHELEDLAVATYDMYFSYTWGDGNASERVIAPEGETFPNPRMGVSLYRTDKGNASLKKAKASSSKPFAPISRVLPAKLKQRLKALRR